MAALGGAPAGEILALKLRQGCHQGRLSQQPNAVFFDHLIAGAITIPAGAVDLVRICPFARGQTPSPAIDATADVDGSLGYPAVLAAA